MSNDLYSDLNKINTKFNEKCLGCLKSKNKNFAQNCIEISNLINEFRNKFGYIDYTNFDKYVKYIIENQKCNKNNYNYIYNFLSVSINYLNKLPSEKTIVLLIKNENYFKLLYDIIRKFNKFEINLNMFIAYFYKINTTNDNTIYNDFIDYIFDNLNIEIIINHFNNLLCKNTYFNTKITNIIEKHKPSLLSNIIVGTKAFIFYPHTKYLIDLILNLDSDLSIIKSIDINTICMYGSPESILLLFNIKKIKPTNKHFTEILNSKCYNNYNLSIRLDYIDNSLFLFSYYNIFNQKKLDTLVSLGYTVKYDDIELTIHYKVELSNIEQYNIECDEKLFKMCIKNKFIPLYNFKNINKDQLILYKKITESNLKDIKEYIEQNPNVKIDYNCYKLIDKHLSSKYNIYEYILENGDFNLDINNDINDIHFDRKIDRIIFNKIIKQYNNLLQSYNQLLNK